LTNGVGDGGRSSSGAPTLATEGAKGSIVSMTHARGADLEGMEEVELADSDDHDDDDDNGNTDRNGDAAAADDDDDDADYDDDGSSRNKASCSAMPHQSRQLESTPVAGIASMPLSADAGGDTFDIESILDRIHGK
jgi:hypothetical protein